MSIRKGNKILATGGSSVKDQNTKQVLKFWSGTLAEYEALGEWSDDILYSITDDDTHEAGGGLEIGDIGIAPLGIDETKGKRRYLNGQIVIQEQYVQFTEKVKSAIALYPTLSCTEDEWQTTTTLTVGGQVGKFVVDDEAGTIRLPKIIMPIQGLTDLSKLAEIVEAGLPNITGSFGYFRGDVDNYHTSSGAFTQSKVSSAGYTGNQTVSGYLTTFDASRSSSTYGNSTTVQQEQIQYPYFIQVATGAETKDEIVNEHELINPYSLGDSKYSPFELNNLSWLKSTGQWNSKAVYTDYYDWLLKIYNGTEIVEGVSVKLSTETFDDYDWVLNTADETFRLPLLNGSEYLVSDRYDNLTLLASDATYTAPANGWFTFTKAVTAVGQYIYLGTNQNGRNESMSSPINTGYLHATLEVKKGEIVTCGYTAGGVTEFFRFVYAQGNGSLYFYVGEVAQNTNLINAGRIEEKIAECITRLDCKAYITETYVNGTSGYIIYSNGYCEQWGFGTCTPKLTLTFLKPFINANYNFVSTTRTGAGDTTVRTVEPELQNVTNTSIILQSCPSYNGTEFYWRACGYVA